MREFEFTFDEGFVKGLRTHHKNPRNAQALVECLNLKLEGTVEEGVVGLAPYTPFVNPFPTAPIVWPFPQILEASEFTFLVIRDNVAQSHKIYKVEDDNSVTFIFEFDDQTFGTQGGMFEIADFGPWFLITNGAGMLKYNVETDKFVALTQSNKLPLCFHLCAYLPGGQIVMANVVSSWEGLGAADVLWSKIGEADMGIDIKNTSGHRRMPRGGNVHKVKQLGKSVMVYSDKEIANLYPVSDPAPTFGFAPLLSIGIIGPNAVAGDEHQHVFVDKYGWVWRITKDRQLKKLGYQEFMKRLDPAKMVVTYHAEELDFYISDGDMTFLLSPYGMTEVHQGHTSIGLVNGIVHSVFKDNNRRDAYYETDTIDFGFRPLKTIEVIEHGATGNTKMRSRLRWKADKSKEFAITPQVEINQEGAATQRVSGMEFRFIFQADDYTKLSLDYIKVRWKMTDLRSIRGVYAPGLRGQKGV